MSVREVVVCADKRALGYAAARFVVGEMTQEANHKFLIALSGGSTPALLYEVLSSDRANGDLINSKCEIFFSDERAVGPDHPDSNFGLARRKLFEPLGIDERIIHRMLGESRDLEGEATRYAAVIREEASYRSDAVPSVDLVLLGMGADGHTASLFPDYDLNRPAPDIVVAPWVEKLQLRRLTFSLELINAARAALILVAGAEKAGAVKSALDSSIIANRVPAGRVAAARTVWMLDMEAARELNWTGRVLSL